MFKELSLKATFAISLSIHFLAFSPWGLFHFHPFKQNAEKKIEVYYVLEERLKKSTNETARNIPQEYNLERKKLQQKKNEAPAKSEKPVTSNKTPEKTLPEEKKQPYVEVENLKEYISYYELLREKIKAAAPIHYTRLSEQGSVNAIFVLHRNGNIKELRIDETESAQSGYLREIAVKSIKSAAPFPPFPEALKKDELTFSIAIIFKKE
ncbi:MAG: energy transducer TonB [Candidatus Omnitrophica bacterium]|nr:energy transducer TonB [Candidatus Omnitrophota bacterium]